MREERLENAKKEIRSVIITYPQGVALDAFLKTFQQLVGVRLPSREFGFTSNIDFLHSLPDIVNIQTDRTGNYLLKCVADENTEHIQKLVSKQRVVKPKTKNIYHSQKEERTTNTTSRVKPFVSAALRKNLFEVLKDYPDGLLYQTLLIAYQTKFKRPLNLDFLSDSPHDRLRKLESAVSELHVKMFGDSERLVYSPMTRNVGAKHHVDVTNGIPPLSSPNNIVEKNQLKVKDSKTTDVSVVPKVVKEDFEKVLKLYPDGLLARYFPFLYEKISGVMFDLADLGYNNFLELADALPDIFICVKPFEKPNDWMLFHPCYSKSADKLIKLNEVLELSSERASQMTKLKKQEIPSDVAPYSRPYTPSQFPNDINLSAYIPVFISAATHPGCFWFKLQIEEVICRFRELEEELQCFYHNIQADAYKMRQKHIMIGATCVARHEDHWYRTTITSSPGDEVVSVYLVDYGSWEKVRCSDLRYLKSQFIDLPSQAFKAQLALVKPTNNSNTWSKRATARFLQLCIKSYIMAQVHLEFEDSLSVLLCDTTGEDDIYINDILVDENLAEKHSSVDRNFTEISFKFQVSETSLVKTNGHLENLPQNNGCYEDLSSYRSEVKEIKDKESFSNMSPSIKRVNLGDGYWCNIMMISQIPHVTATDLCHLLWQDKPEEVLKSRLKCKNLEIPTTTIFRKDHEHLFQECENNGLIPAQRCIELYSLTSVMKVLNCFGHPSTKVRQAIIAELKSPSHSNGISEMPRHSPEASAKENHSNCESDINKCCLYDLKAMYEAVKFKRFLLQKKQKTLSSSTVQRDLMEAEALMESIQQRMDYINSLCSSYSSYE